MRLKGKVAIVTGGGSGIGRAITEQFATHGAQVVIAEIDPNLGRNTAKIIRDRGEEALFVRADVGREEDVERMVAATVEHYRKVDVLVNNAGVLVTGNALELSEEDWDRCMRIDLKSAWLCSKHAVPRMTGGSIINIASTHPLRAQPNYLPYVVAKGGVLALTLSMAVDFGPRGIRVNSLCPGFIETPLSEHVLAQWKQSPEIYEAVLATHPLRRLAKPKDVAYAATFLASDESSFITGTTLIVDGGRMAYGYSFGDMPSRR